MIIRTSLCMAAALVFLCGCAIKKIDSIKRMEWLIGTWEHKTSKGTLYETWSKASKNELTGKSYMLKGKDTIIYETIRLVQDKDMLFYIPVVKNQNGGSPIRFEGKTISKAQFVFENKTHDFPQVISYLKINEDSLKAEISGLRNGQEERRYFPMKRLK